MSSSLKKSYRICFSLNCLFSLRKHKESFIEETTKVGFWAWQIDMVTRHLGSFFHFYFML